MEGWDEQNLDLYCSWPFCFIICLFRHLIVYAAKWHWSHLNGFSPVCFLWWILSDWVPSYRKKYPSFFKPIFRKLQDDLKSSLHMIFFAPQNTLNWFHTDCDYFNSNPFRPQSNKRLAKYFQTMFQFGLIFWSDHHINIFWILKDHHHRPCVSAGVGESHGRGDQIMAASYQLPTPPPSFPPLPPHSPSSSYSSLSSVSFFHISPPFQLSLFPSPPSFSSSSSSSIDSPTHLHPTRETSFVTIGMRKLSFQINTLSVIIENSMLEPWVVS